MVSLGSRPSQYLDEHMLRSTCRYKKLRINAWGKMSVDVILCSHYIVYLFGEAMCAVSFVGFADKHMFR
jgi:hypothetical protein